MTYKEVRNISINNPCTIEVPPPRVVRQFKVPGVIAWMIAAPCSSAHSAQFGWGLTVIPPRICETASKAPRLGVNAPTRTMPRETAGLKRPPETRKKIHAFTAREKPKHNEMYSLACQLAPKNQRRKNIQVGSVDCCNCRSVLSCGCVSSDGVCGD